MNGPRRPRRARCLLRFRARADRAAAIVGALSEVQRLAVVFGLGVDYLFMALCPTAVIAGLAVMARRHPRCVGPLRMLSWGLVVCVFADMAEDALLMGVVLGERSLAPFASACAVVKFATLSGGLGVVIGLAARRAR